MKARLLILCSLVLLIAPVSFARGKKAAPTGPGTYKEWGPDIDQIEILQSFSYNVIEAENGDVAISLWPKIRENVDLLLVLVQNHGHVVEKDLLIKEIWPDTFVEDSNVSCSASMAGDAAVSSCGDQPAWLRMTGLERHDSRGHGTGADR